MEFTITYKASDGEETPRKETLNLKKVLSAQTVVEVKKIIQDNGTMRYEQRKNDDPVTVWELDRPFDTLETIGKIIAKEVLPKHVDVGKVEDNSLMSLSELYQDVIFGFDKKKEEG